MGYRKADKVLPIEIIEMIQEYVDGECIYIPRKENQRKEWGTTTNIRQELRERNGAIFKDATEGWNISELASKYFLSEKSIQRILHEKSRND